MLQCGSAYADLMISSAFKTRVKTLTFLGVQWRCRASVGDTGQLQRLTGVLPHTPLLPRVPEGIVDCQQLQHCRDLSILRTPNAREHLCVQGFAGRAVEGRAPPSCMTLNASPQL